MSTLRGHFLSRVIRGQPNPDIDKIIAHAASNYIKSFLARFMPRPFYCTVSG